MSGRKVLLVACEMRTLPFCLLIFPVREENER
jgi:hypothetical protein